MSIEPVLRQALQSSSRLRLENGWTLELIQENAFEVRTESCSYFVKWIAEDDEYGQNEIRINQEILADNELPAPRLVEVIKTSAARIACWEWLNGSDLRQNERQHLARAFERLGQFHKKQRHHGSVYSPITRQPFLSAKELLDDDWNFLTTACDIPQYARRSHLAPLETGYPTIIHGDMHPGNLRLTANGLYFVDWGFAQPSLNLFDLDYIHAIALDPNPDWWIIRPDEAASVLPSYYQSCGMDGANQSQLQRSIMIYTELHSLYNATQKNNQEGAAHCRIHLKILCD